jgi:hypothetical protein
MLRKYKNFFRERKKGKRGKSGKAHARVSERERESEGKFFFPFFSHNFHDKERKNFRNFQFLRNENANVGKYLRGFYKSIDSFNCHDTLICESSTFHFTFMTHENFHTIFHFSYSFSY